MELVETVKELLMETAKSLKGSARRLFLARTVRTLGAGGQPLAERELGWNRGTIRKGQHELEHGIVCIDGWETVKGRFSHITTLHILGTRYGCVSVCRVETTMRRVLRCRRLNASAVV
jgi:hypothetical protein